MTEFKLSVDAKPAPWLDRRDPRLRIVAAAVCALIVVSLARIPSLLLGLGLALGLAFAAGLSLRQILRRLLALEGFMLVLLILLPFSVPGRIWFEIGPFSASHEGLQRALIIALKANTVVLFLLPLIGRLDPTVLGHALARLKTPDKLVHLYLFSVRYVGVLHAEYSRLRLAMRARGFVAGSNRHTWRSFGWLSGMLLVRSLNRSQRILAAMRCRGFDGRLYVLDNENWRIGDSLWAGAFALGATGLLLLEHLG